MHAHRLNALLCADVKLQFRHGFYAAYAVLTILYVLGLNALSPTASEGVLRAVAVVLIFTDPATLGAFFVGGLVLLEKQHGSLEAVMVTPVRRREYLASKAASLTVLALATTAAMAWATGLPVRPGPLLVGCGLTSILFVLLGLAVVAGVHTVQGYLLAMVPVVTLPMIPAARFLGLETPLLWLIPTQGSLRLMEAGLGGAPLNAAELLYAALALPGAAAAAGVWAAARFARVFGHAFGPGMPRETRGR